MDWHKPFDRLLKAMASGEPHKAEKKERPEGEGASRPAVPKERR